MLPYREGTAEDDRRERRGSHLVRIEASGSPANKSDDAGPAAPLENFFNKIKHINSMNRLEVAQKNAPTSRRP